MIQVLYPWVLCAGIAPVLIYYLVPAARIVSRALRVPFLNDLSDLLQHNSIFSYCKRISWRTYLLVIIWLLLVISGAGLIWLGQPQDLPRTGRDIFLAVDLSGSMQTPDMQINGVNTSRIDIVRQVAKQFINSRVGDKLGLILFGSKAYLQTPLTFDHNTLSAMLNEATIGLAGEQTAIGDGVALAVKQLISYSGTSKALILLTDGGNNAGVFQPLEATKLASKAHIKIYTIGIGASQMQIATPLGVKIINPSSDLDINTLKQIANITGGKFFRAEDGNQLQSIYTQINNLEPIQSAPVTIRPLTQLYPWSLGLALILSFLLLWLKLWKP